MLYHILILLIVLGLVSCKKAKVSSVTSQPLPWLDKLKEKHAKYLELTAEVRDEYGFVRNCDGLLFTALGSIGGYSVDLSVAEGRDESGEPNALWYRTPTHDCYSGDGPGSDISKDMLLGLLWASIRERNLPRLERLFEYGMANGWYMGRGDTGATLLTPSLVASYAEAIYKLGGNDYLVERNYPQLWNAGLLGYQSHLQIVHILIRFELLGSIDNAMFDRIKEHYGRAPENALFSYAYHLFTDGDYSEAVHTLMDSKLFPEDRLPNDGDRYPHYLWERDPYEYVPGGGDESWPGVDFLLVSKLIQEQHGG